MELSARYESMFADLVGSLLGHSWPDGSLSAFWPAAGAGYKKRRGLLVVGRATNGWCRPFSAGKLRGPHSGLAIARSARDCSEEGEDTLAWLAAWAGRKKGYNPNRSAFWRVAKRVLLSVNGAASTKTWSRHLAWTNLYKVAPSADARQRGKTANPSLALLEAQKRGCVSLFRQELRELRPALVLVLAGSWWYRPFMEALEIDTDGLATRAIVEDVRQHMGATWVFAKHPQGKKEDALVRRAVEAFGRRLK